MFMNIFILLGNSSTYRHNVIDIWAKHCNSYIEYAGHFGDEVGDDPVGDFALVFAERSDGFTITGWYLPLWKIVSWDYYSQYMKKQMFQATKQITKSEMKTSKRSVQRWQIYGSNVVLHPPVPFRSASLSRFGAPCEDPPHNSTCAAVWHWAPSLHWFLGGPASTESGPAEPGRCQPGFACRAPRIGITMVDLQRASQEHQMQFTCKVW